MKLNSISFSAIGFCFILVCGAEVPEKSSSHFADINLVNLRCGSWRNPLGIDDQNPRLSWQVVATDSATRGQNETAYEIRVASSPELLASNRPDLWDSGKVVSPQPFNVPYSGNRLVSAQKVFWQVRVWDQNDSASAWSSTENWTMGLLNFLDWKGSWLAAAGKTSSMSLADCSWIWFPNNHALDSAPVGTRYFRRKIPVRGDSALTIATLLLTADNSFTAYVNGLNVGHGQDYQSAVPLEISQLKAGDNVIAIAASNGGSVPNPAGLIGKVNLKYADGMEISVPVDSTWKAADSLQTGWQMPGFDDRSWTNAEVLGRFGVSPWGTNVNVMEKSVPLLIFRRQFTVKSGLQRALIYICGLGQYELSANGTKVGDSLLAPGWTKYDKTCLYDTLDLTSCLTNGPNVVGVMLGNGMYNVFPTSRYTKFTGSFGPPKMIAQIHLFYTNGTSEVIATDREWQTSQGPITYSHVYGGEDFDARLVQPGWDQADFNASSWSAASATNGPGGILRGQSHAAPPMIAGSTLPPIQSKRISDDIVLYDLGQNAALIPSLTVHGQRGSVVQITPAEMTNSDSTVNRTSVGGGAAYWQYTLAGSGIETWTPKFFSHGCRFLQVKLKSAAGSFQLPTIDSLSGTVVQSACEDVGEFSCSNELFNRTRTLIHWAQRNNLVSLLTDCPHRERLGWLEQYNLHGPSLRYEMDVGQVFAKTMQDMEDSQTPAGLVPDIAPEYVVFGGGFRDSPEWGSSVIIVPWQHYLFTGDDALLRNYYSAMTNYFGYLQNQSINNFLKYPHGLGDWYDIGTNAPGFSQLTPISLTADAYYCLDAQILGKAAAAIGNVEDASRFGSLATNIGVAFNKVYYSPSNHCYATGSQTAQALPLSLGIVDPENKDAVTAALVSNVRSRGLTAGDIGHRYLLRALADMGRSDVVFGLHSGSDHPGYGYILKKGATALTEAWDANPTSSQDHFMLGHITEWFYHDLAGIQPDPDAPGFQHVIIHPAFIDGITWVKASYNSVRGKIVSNWSLTNHLATLEVDIPVGSTSSICLPILGDVTDSLLINESGTLIWRKEKPDVTATGLHFDRVQGMGSQTCLKWTVGSGHYRFKWNVPDSQMARASDNDISAK